MSNLGSNKKISQFGQAVGSALANIYIHKYKYKYIRALSFCRYTILQYSIVKRNKCLFFFNGKQTTISE